MKLFKLAAEEDSRDAIINFSLPDKTYPIKGFTIVIRLWPSRSSYVTHKHFDDLKMHECKQWDSRFIYFRFRTKIKPRLIFEYNQGVSCKEIKKSHSLIIDEGIQNVRRMMEAYQSIDINHPPPSPDCSRCGDKSLQNYFTGKDTGRIVCPSCKDYLERIGKAR